MTLKSVRVVIVAVALGVGGVLVPPSVEAQSATLRGLVIGADGSVRPNAVVRLAGTADKTASQPNPQPVERFVMSEANGSYVFMELPTGTYTVDAFASGRDRDAVAHLGAIKLESPDNTDRNLVLATRSWSDPQELLPLALTIGAIFLYLLLLLLFRFYNIIAPSRALLDSQLHSVATRLRLEVEETDGARVKELVDGLANIRASLGTVTWGSTLFWSRGEELAAWSRIHEVERQLATFLAPVPRVLERVQTAEAELRAKASPEAVVLADRMRDTLRVWATLIADPAADPEHVDRTISHVKQQLAEALAIIYDDRDTQFASLMEWQNKAMWLTNIALMLIAALALAFDDEWLFLVGAAGGLMSRLARTLFREDIPTDYGASWTTLFLSPLLGAIAAWFGILLIVALFQMGVLGGALAEVTWPPVFNAITVGLAFLLGFSERLFTTLLSTVEGQVQSQLQAKKPAGGGAAAAAMSPPPSGTAMMSSRETSIGSPPPPADIAVRLLDLTKGERATFIGDAQSPIRKQLIALVGEANLFTIEVAQLSSVAPVDGVLLEKVPEAAGLPAAAASIYSALAPNGRLVVVGSTPAGLFDADAEHQRARGQVGPALVHEAMTGAGLLGQEPPERLDGADPIRWVSAFLKSASAG